MKSNLLSIIIPVKNEAFNISPLAKRINKAMSRSKISYEMIFIDDFSTDRTHRTIKVLQEVYPIKLYKKQGQEGKAYSILEAVQYTKAEYVVMIDADLQYPPEAIPEMFKIASQFGVVLGDRISYHGSFLRKFFSQSFSFIFGRLLHGFNLDVQSGLKLIKREILLQIDVSAVSPWTLDLAVLNCAREMGFEIGGVDIEFEKRKFDKSKVNLIKSSFEIGLGAIKQKIFKKKIFTIPSLDPLSMIGAGVIHKRKRLITHTNLSPNQTALKTFTDWQILLICALIILLEAGLILKPLTTIITVVAFLSTIYFLDVLFNLYIILKSLHFPPEISIEKNELRNIESKKLPVYSILCPLYKEGKILPHFLRSLEKLDWPKDKLDVILLLEEDDTETYQVASQIKLPDYIRVITVPASEPKTKPKACNFGLGLAKGEYLVIFDAEDRPDPNQLKKAYLAFQNVKDDVVCLQAKLNYYNPHQNLLTRFFTAEYSLWFDVILTGLQSINTVIPLGGTSNHFKTSILRDLKGWDPFNVTEDCDLGVRLFKSGYKTAIFDSTTFEEANSNLKNWIRQRSRWIKGYMQTFLVHMRNPFQFIKDHGIHAFIFQLVIGIRISFMLINPILWVMTIAYFTLYEFVGPTIESFYPSVVFYMAVSSLIIGNFMYIYSYMIGLAKKGHWSLIKYIPLVPVYWLLASIASVIALYQLISKPHYWEKTHHGLYLARQQDDFKIPRIILKPAYSSIRYFVNMFF